MPDSNISKLFSETLVGDYDDDAPWKAVHALRQIGSREVFDEAALWCRSNVPVRRARGLDVLAQIGKTVDHPEHSFPAESYDIAVRLLKQEQEVRPLTSAIYALGHIENAEAVPLIAAYQSHPDADVRYAVTFGLASFPDDSQSIESLLVLLNDADDDVRDWAAFGLGTLGNCDSSAIRDALFRRLSDSNGDVRQEAIAGLAKRRDERVLPILIETLEKPKVADCIVEAAYQMLGMNSDREDWDTSDYVAALRARFH